MIHDPRSEPTGPAPDRESEAALFTPHIERRDCDGGTCRFTFSTLTPNGCYAAGEAREGVPEGRSAVPEAMSIVLEVGEQGTMCAQFLKTVQHSIEVERPASQRSLIVWVVEDGEVRGEAAFELSDVETKHGDSGLLGTSDWCAWQATGERMSGGAAFVEGRVTLVNPCYDARLTRRDEAGDGAVHLDLEVQRRPDDQWCPAVVVHRSVQASFHDPAELPVDEIVVHLPDGETLTLPMRAPRAALAT